MVSCVLGDLNNLFSHYSYFLILLYHFIHYNFKSNYIPFKPYAILNLIGVPLRPELNSILNLIGEPLRYLSYFIIFIGAYPSDLIHIIILHFSETTPPTWIELYRKPTDNNRTIANWFHSHHCQNRHFKTIYNRLLWTERHTYFWNTHRNEINFIEKNLWTKIL